MNSCGMIRLHSHKISTVCAERKSSLASTLLHCLSTTAESAKSVRCSGKKAEKPFLCFNSSAKSKQQQYIEMRPIFHSIHCLVHAHTPIHTHKYTIFNPKQYEIVQRSKIKYNMSTHRDSHTKR